MIMTSTVNVMMVKMAEDASRTSATVVLWHETICRLAFLMVPLAVFLFVAARHVVVALYTPTYLASVPIFMVWALTILPSIFAVNAVLRVFAQTRFLLVMNLLRLGMVALLIGWFLSSFGMSGAVLVTLVSTLLINLVGVGRIAHLLQLSFARALPWSRLGGIFLRAIVAAIPVIWLTHEWSWSPVVALGLSGVAYAVTYFGLSYLARLKADSTDDPRWVAVPSRLSGT
jgi:O-antigen/teichoic acid export membrane protein